MTEMTNIDKAPCVRVLAQGPLYTVEQLIEAFNPSHRKTHPGEPNEPQPSPLTQQQINAFADAAAVDCEKDYPDLWAGDWEGTPNVLNPEEKAFPSQSEADYFVISELANWVAQNGVSKSEWTAVIERAFEKSGLASRDKWRTREDYRKRTIDSASAGIQLRPRACARDIGSTLPGNNCWHLQGDTRNACYFGNKYQQKFRYVFETGAWLYWSGERWHWCKSGEEVEAAKEAAIQMLADVYQLQIDPKSVTTLANDVKNAQNKPRLEAMLNLARSIEGIRASAKELDQAPELLGVRNGVVDLKTGNLLQNKPEYLITNYCAADYHASALCARWERFLDEVFQGNSETISAIQTLLGLTLTGVTSEEYIVFCVGNGANGKSIFGDVVSTILGDYAKVAPSNMLESTQGRANANRDDLTRLRGCRLASFNELPAGMQLDETVTKQIAGREPITARPAYGGYITFVPTFTPWVRSNHKPIVKGNDYGIWRRIILVSFSRQFGPNERDPLLEQKLLAERDGILAWMVRGAQLYYKSGVTLSKAMSNETDSYRAQSDIIAEFLSDHAEEDPDQRVKQTSLFKAWGSWCEKNGYQKGAKSTFTSRLGEKGFAASRSNGERYYTGLKLVRQL